MNTVKKILVIPSFICIVISGFHTFCSIPILKMVLSTYDIKGYMTAVIMMCICFYAVWSQKKMPFYITSILTLLLSVYAFYNTWKLYDADLVQLGMGFYEYLVGSILVLINVLLPWEKDVTKQETESPSPLDKITQNNTLAYIYGFYVHGFSKFPTMKPCVLQNNIDKKQVSIFVANSEEVKEKHLAYQDIQELTYKARPLVDQKPRLAEDYKSENMLLSGALLSPGFSTYALQGVLDTFTQGYDSVKIKVLYQITLFYIENGEGKTVLMETYKNPSSFLEQIPVTK